uniref:Uncharacterized protein n=1 Tax=Chlorocebus sabaeus TaxID=60711 RepID=A0A0D9R500_CHLSB
MANVFIHLRMAWPMCSFISGRHGPGVRSSQDSMADDSMADVFIHLKTAWPMCSIISGRHGPDESVSYEDDDIPVPASLLHVNPAPPALTTPTAPVLHAAPNNTAQKEKVP